MNTRPRTARTVNADAARPLSQAALARELGISPPAVTKLKAQGMPTHDADAARAWRAEHLQAGRVRPDPGPSPQTLLKRVHELAELAQRALDLGRGFDALVGELRQALHAVPAPHRDGVVLSFDLWRALIGTHACSLIEHGSAMEPQAGDQADDEEDEVGAVAYQLAAGEAHIKW